MKISVNALMLLPALLVFPTATLAATPPVAQNTVLTMGLALDSMPAKVVIWDNLSAGFDENDQPKWGRNTLVCQSRTDKKYGACLNRPVWNNSSVRPTKITLNFTLAETTTVVSLVIEGSRKTIPKTDGKRCTLGTIGSAEADGPCEAFFTFSIPQAELKKLSAGRWTATLKQDLMQWPITSCSGDWSSTAEGCTNVTKLHTWSADIVFNVTDNSNQQIYLPAFPTSAPVVNLNLKTRPGVGSGKSVSGSTSLDVCLYDGNNSASKRISLLFQDEGITAPERADGQFSLYRNGGDKSKPRDRLDYQVSVINPTTGAVQNVANGKEIVWSDTNRRNIQRLVVLPGGGAAVLCVPAPLTLTTPAFSMADKTAGDYTGKLRVVYMPTTQ
ncbi:CfaE/CblD family pilus tip adhesin [Serratia fonticola]|uniref:CfaE/CblD family pilus tip adhesin n=1 Tax=Serratia fonticola TaxID=47917 RepID=UPI00164839B2|nr:CfaE/CblD family pilus tip adhesin [Serratia fonticola]MBC3228697.1 phage tail protein [Serratia fonticola]